MEFFLIVAHFLYFILFLIPGFAVYIFLKKRYCIDSHYLLSKSLLFSFFIIHISFWIFFYDFKYGLYFCRITETLSFIYLTIHYKTFKNLVKVQKGLIPISLVFLTGIFYLSHLGIYLDDSGRMNANHRYMNNMPIDNILPSIAANCIHEKEPLHLCYPNLGLEFWTVSDRPPLFAAAIAYLKSFSFLNNPITFYQYLGTFLQCSFIIGLWDVLTYYKTTKTIRWFILGVCIFSGFTLYNSVFLWPKVVTFTLFIIAYILLIKASKGQSLFINHLIIIGISLGLSNLAHGGILFSIIPIMFLFLLLRRNIIHVVAIFLIFLSLQIPWMLYQKFIDPPGDHLIKSRIAGQRNGGDPDSIQLYAGQLFLNENDSTFKAIMDSYTKVPTEAIISNNISNFHYLFRNWIYIAKATIKESFKKGLDKDFISYLRTTSHMLVFYNFGILNISLIILLYSLILRIFKSTTLYNDTHLIAIFLLISFVLWCLIMFEPNATSIHQGSYANIFLMYIFAGLGFKSLNRWIVYIIFFFNSIVFLYIWGLPIGVCFFCNEINTQMGIISLLTACILLGIISKNMLKT